ncbi:MAG: indolepyruvate ferredoxin oxidoreductase subunit alpha [Deltaproteobacteria bacterium]|nr:indolepyruvate ferredoxin oxidoreductase subunit alpha [Deltaproteobacteria bacterium]
MHKLLEDLPGKEMLVLGNEAIARGALEAGVACATTYPGTPSSEISANLFAVSRETDLYFEYSTNEKVALEVAAAAANCGVRSLCIMKHVGLNVAADVLMTLAYIGVKGGLVILTADDPYMFSSQNEQDNRYYAKLSGLPMLEPSSISEAKEMVGAALTLSEQLGEPVILRTTTRINHSTAKITLGKLAERKTKGSFAKDPFRYVAVPAVSRKLHTLLLQNLDKARELSEISPYNFFEGSGDLGIVCSGVSHAYVSDAVRDLGITGRVRVFRVGFSHPLPEKRLKSFLRDVKKVLVVEEGEPVLEEALRNLAQQEAVTVPIRGKGEDLFSREGEYDPAGVREAMAHFFGLSLPAKETIDLSGAPAVPQRPPNLCAGCPHRATFYEIKQAAGQDAVFPTDIGCYTLGLLPPLSAADFLICMGSSVGTAAGFSRFQDKRVVAFIGDSTFFHSGIPGLVNAVFNNHDFTLVILDNGTTAMTGHQPHPGVDMEALGYSGYGRISIEEVVRALGVQNVLVTDPYKVKKSVAALKELFAKKGVSVVISRQYCPLFARALKTPRKKPFRVSRKCAGHRVCIDTLACPAMYVDDGQVAIHADQCTGCAVCAQVCPENAILPVRE